MIGTYRVLTKVSKEENSNAVDDLRQCKSALVRGVNVIKRGLIKKHSQKFQPRWNGESPINRGNSGVVYRVSMLALAIAMDWISSKPFA